MFNRHTVKLGKGPARHNPKALFFHHYLTSDLPPAPPSLFRSHLVTQAWGMLDNDRLGDCTCAGALHAIMLINALAGKGGVTFTNADADRLYQNFGYNPALDPPAGSSAENPTDQGANEEDVLNFWRQQGIYGHALLAHVACRPTNVAAVKQALNLFGTLYLGVGLPTMTEGEEQLWDLKPTAPAADQAIGSWGYHCVVAAGDYDDQGLTIVSWGEVIKVTWAYFTRYFDEVHVPLSPELLGPGQMCPAGFNLNALQADLAALSHC